MPRELSICSWYGFPNFWLLPAFQEVQSPVLHLQKEGKELRLWTLPPVGRHCKHTIRFPFSQEPLLSWKVSFPLPKGAEQGSLTCSTALTQTTGSECRRNLCTPKLCLPALPTLHLVMGWREEISQQQSLPCNLGSNTTPQGANVLITMLCGPPKNRSI